MDFAATGLWRDVLELPGALDRTVAAAEGVAPAARLLGGRDVRRVVAVGNGAAYYVGLALWLASLEGPGGGPELVAVPSGLALGPRFRMRDGDALLAISSSGEFRDVVEIVAGDRARPCVALTAAASSSLAGAADVVVLQHVSGQRAVTHTQALAGAYALGLAVWAEITGDAALRGIVAAAPDAAGRAVEQAAAWAREHPAPDVPVAAVAAGGGTAWAAAVELALMLKEVARVPAEGVETREGATSAMFGLAAGHLMVSLDPPGDALAQEALRLCAATGAATIRLPGAEAGDARLSFVNCLPASAALAAQLALAAGHDVDAPSWTDAYYRTARGDGDGVPA